MDIKHVLSRNPMQPAFDAIRPRPVGRFPGSAWHAASDRRTQFGRYRPPVR
jgi:hypothetical protein